MTQFLTFVDVVFDGPPGPVAEGHHCEFVEVEGPDGSSVTAGEWTDRGDGTWRLRIPTNPVLPNLGLATTRELLEEVEVRMRVSQNSNAGCQLGDLCGEALRKLASGVLNYRTVGL